jgi:hypothetical protein
MIIDRNTLPDDPARLKELLLEVSAKYEELRVEHERELHDEKFKYHILEKKYLTLPRHFFGKRSEKLTAEDKEQMLYLNIPGKSHLRVRNMLSII